MADRSGINLLLDLNIISHLWVTFRLLRVYLHNKSVHHITPLKHIGTILEKPMDVFRH